MKLPAIEHQLLPPDLVLDPNHPANDKYIKSAQEIQRAIIAASKKLTQRGVQATKLKHQAIPNAEIANRLNVTPNTVSKLTNTKEAKSLLTLLAYYGSLIAGPHIAQRGAMLWRIALENEIDQPKTSIAAIAELNKVEIAFKEQQLGQKQQAPIIILNQESLPRTALDGEVSNGNSTNGN